MNANTPHAERLMACLGPSPSSSRVLQVAARMARDLGTAWTALYVQTPEASGLSGAERERLRGHFELARRLGAELVTIQGTDVVEQIAAYTRLHGIVRVVIGKDLASRRSPIRLSSDRVQKLLRLRPDLELHVVPGTAREPGGGPRRAVRLREGTFTPVNLLKALLILGAATGLGLAWQAWGFTEANLILLFLLAVLLIALFAGRLLGLVFSLAAVLTFNFFFTEPRGTLLVTDPRYLITFPVMLAVALIASELTNRLRRQARSSEERERRTERLYRTSRSLLAAAGRAAVIASGMEHLRDLLHREVICYLPDGSGSLQPQAEAAGFQDGAAAWSFAHGRPAGKGTDSYPETGAYYRPLSVQELTLGVIGVDCSTGPLDEAEAGLLEAVAAQLALALDRERLERVEEEQRVAIERERLRNDLLRSISHDLRTPLTAIAGASSMLSSGAGPLNGETGRELARGIYEDATWLTRLVENLLSLTRVEGDALKLNRDWEVAEDLVASALERFRGRRTTHRFRTSLPEEPILVRVDPALIEQVLVNLIDNAIRYTPAGSSIEIRTAADGREVVFEVADNGPGLSPNALRHLFERFFTEGPPTSERRGLGLGLAISRSIVEAHGGTIEAENREGRGAVFRFRLPRGEAPPPGAPRAPDPRSEP